MNSADFKMNRAICDDNNVDMKVIIIHKYLDRSQSKSNLIP